MLCVAEKTLKDKDLNEKSAKPSFESRRRHMSAVSSV